MQTEQGSSSTGVSRAISGTTVALGPESAALRGDEPDSDERWRAWRARGAKADREASRTMSRGFITIMMALSAWLIFQLLSRT